MIDKDRQRLPKIAKDCRRSLKIKEDCRRSPKIGEDFRSWPKITKDCQRSPKITRDHQRLPKIAQTNGWKLLKTVSNGLKPFIKLWKSGKKKLTVFFVMTWRTGIHCQKWLLSTFWFFVAPFWARFCAPLGFFTKNQEERAGALLTVDSGPPGHYEKNRYFFLIYFQSKIY